MSREQGTASWACVKVYEASFCVNSCPLDFSRLHARRFQPTLIRRASISADLDPRCVNFSRSWSTLCTNPVLQIWMVRQLIQIQPSVVAPLHKHPSVAGQKNGFDHLALSTLRRDTPTHARFSRAWSILCTFWLLQPRVQIILNSLCTNTFCEPKRIYRGSVTIPTKATHIGNGEHHTYARKEM